MSLCEFISVECWYEWREDKVWGKRKGGNKRKLKTGSEGGSNSAGDKERTVWWDVRLGSWKQDKEIRNNHREEWKAVVKKESSFPRAGICLLEAAPPSLYCSSAERLLNDLLFCFDANENQSLFSKWLSPSLQAAAAPTLSTCYHQ